MAQLEQFLGIPMEKIYTAIHETVYMVSISLLIGTVLAFIIGIALVFTKKGGLYENRIIYTLINVVINVIRSTPFVVLLVAVMPLTKAIIGTRIGPTAAIVPLTIFIVPLLSRLIENSLLDTGKGIYEAAKSMGATPFQRQRAHLSLALQPELWDLLVQAQWQDISAEAESEVWFSTMVTTDSTLNSCTVL